MVEVAPNGFGKAEAPAKPVPPGPYTPGAPVGVAGAAPGLDQEKRLLTSKLWELQKTGIDAKAKWWSFCKVHAEGVTDTKGHDVAFLQTFFEAFEAGDIGIEEGCPFVQPQQPLAKGAVGKDGGGKAAGGKDFGAKGFGKDAGKGFGKDAGKGFGKDAGKSFGKDAGKSFGKDAGKGFGKDSGKGFGKVASKGFGKDAGKGKGGGGGASDDCKIFVGGIPKASTEEELKAHFSYYGTVTACMYKYDEMGGFRGFAFVTFDSPEAASKVLADAASQSFKGKWIDCKTASPGGGGAGGKSSDKGGKGKSFDKGGKSFDKGGKSSDKGGKSFDKGGKSFDKGGKSFDKGGKSFDKGGKSFDKGGGKSFDKGGKFSKGKW